MGEVYFALCKSVDSPVSLACWLRYKHGEHLQLAEKRIKPAEYLHLSDFRDDYLVVSYLSKWTGLDTGVDKEKVALEAFASSESKCKETNRRLKDAASGVKFNPAVEPVLLLAQQKIADVLGPLRWIDALECVGWGKGATATLKGAEANLVRKIDPGMGRISVTRGALDLIVLLIESDPCWASAILKKDVVGPFSLLRSQVFEIVPGNKITTVPKDATKDRTIAAEPTANIFMQLGVGRLIRRRLLKRCGIDLDDQGPNQRAALRGSAGSGEATLDLKSASDTVSKELIEQLIPCEWLILLKSLRSPKGTIDGSNWFEYEKFSSMGNGFTFELETLIFWALAVATLQHHGYKGRVLVYGDDVILPSEAYTAYSEVLSYCGFEVNSKKSFSDGYFRESCGGHYWNGHVVTPVYQKESIWSDRKVVLPEAYRCANRILRLAYGRGHRRWLDRTLEKCWLAIRRVYGLQKPRHAIPIDTEGDDGLALPREELLHYISPTRTTREREPVYHRYSCEVLSFRALELDVPEFYQRALLSYWLRHNPSEPFEGRVAVRRRGFYVSRRRQYPIGTSNVVWL